MISRATTSKPPRAERTSATTMAMLVEDTKTHHSPHADTPLNATDTRLIQQQQTTNKQTRKKEGREE
jgi:hypothetical protein